MKTTILTSLICATLFVAAPQYNYSTTSVVTLIGAKIAAKSTEAVAKYKRKDCPVCKGKGWYISGDGIAKIQCQYCEP